VFTVLLLFFALLLRTAYHFEFCDYDNLLSQYKARQKEENSNQWSFQKMKTRLKWYGLFFVIIFIISLWQTQMMANISFTLNVVLALLFGCAVATVVATALSEYTLGGLHRNRPLHIFLIGGLVAYAFARYIFDFIG
jgi:hypothetical protein